MTSSQEDTITDNLQEAIIKLEPSSIGTEPYEYIKKDKLKTDFLTQWTKTGSCMSFMEPAKKGIGIAMLIGAEHGNIIAYAISNSTGQFIQFDYRLAVIKKFKKKR